MRARATWFLVVIFALGGCGAHDAPPPLVDSGPPDAEVIDARLVDAGRPDAGPPDAPPPDAPPPDAPPPDAAPPDAAPPDAPIVDSGPPDAPLEVTCGGLVVATVVGEGTYSDSTTGEINSTSAGCSTSTGSEDDVFQIDVPAGHDLVAVVTPAVGFDPIVDVRTICNNATTDIDCSDGPMATDAETVEVLDASGIYYVVINGYLGDEGDYTMVIDFRPVLGEGQVCDPTGVDNRCGGGLVCADDGSGTNVCGEPPDPCLGAPVAVSGVEESGSVMFGAEDQLTPSCGVDSNTGEAIFAITVADGAALQVTDTGSGFGTISVYGPGGCEMTALSCDSGATLQLITDTLAAGTYYVVFDGFGGYELLIQELIFIDEGGACDPPGDLCEAGTYCFDGFCADAPQTVIDTPPNADFCDAQIPISAGDFVLDADITGGTDYDMVEVVVSMDGTLVAYTTDVEGLCTVNTLIEVYEADGLSCTTLEAAPPAPTSTDDDSAFGVCSFVEMTVMPDTYYVRVRRPVGSGSTGDYILVVDVQ